MEIPKAQILDLLRKQGDHGKADEADAQLPDQVDTERDAGLLSKLGLDAGDIMGKLGGLGGLGGKLGL